MVCGPWQNGVPSRTARIGWNPGQISVASARGRVATDEEVGRIGSGTEGF